VHLRGRKQYLPQALPERLPCGSDIVAIHLHQRSGAGRFPNRRGLFSSALRIADFGQLRRKAAMGREHRISTAGLSAAA